ncbi:putative secondary metabolism biosynthetic enzyme [Tricholoma furcatifolium]|nr:putative secondary metabolism biosynthetic enzyme [Tricholoma furcatifolium]
MDLLYHRPAPGDPPCPDDTAHKKAQFTSFITSPLPLLLIEMDAACFPAPRQVEIIRAPIPQITQDQVLIKVSCTGVCGSDTYIAEGNLIHDFPLIPGHEIVGTIATLGRAIDGLAVGDHVVVDPISFCGDCFFCRRRNHLMCENLQCLGVSTAGGVAEYVAVSRNKVHKIYNITDEEATLIEPASCVIHALDKISSPPGVEALVFGAGPTGLLFAQLLKLNGASKVVIAANKGIKTQVARELGCADEYVELDRNNPEPQWAELKRTHPYGFDVVVEATGAETLANEAINYVRRGGTLLVYGVYSNDARVHWPPNKIFGDEIRIIGSFAQTHCFPRAVDYLDSGKVRVKGMITDSFSIKDYRKALDKLKSKDAVKIIIKVAQ